MFKDDKDFFVKLEGPAYKSFAELKIAANRIAVQNLSAFPPHFEMRTYLNAAIRRGWITRTDKGIEVAIPKQHHSPAD